MTPWHQLNLLSRGWSEDGWSVREIFNRVVDGMVDRGEPREAESTGWKEDATAAKAMWSKHIVGKASWAKEPTCQRWRLNPATEGAWDMREEANHVMVTRVIGQWWRYRHRWGSRGQVGNGYLIIAILNIIIISLMILIILYLCFFQNHYENWHIGLNGANNNRRAHAYPVWKHIVYRNLCFYTILDYPQNQMSSHPLCLWSLRSI